MALSEKCKQLLVGLAASGGAIAAKALGLDIISGAVLFATNGGNLALTLADETLTNARKFSTASRAMSKNPMAKPPGWAARNLTGKRPKLRSSPKTSKMR